MEIIQTPGGGGVLFFSLIVMQTHKKLHNNLQLLTDMTMTVKKNKEQGPKKGGGSNFELG